MRNKAFNALSYSYSASDKVMFDANILVSLFSGLEPPGSVQVRNYSQVLKSIRQSGAVIVLDVLVLSEFVNVCARKHFSLALAQGGVWTSFKGYRHSDEFRMVALTIARAAQQIVKLARRLDHPFSAWPIEDLLNDYATGAWDVNDQFIIKLCRHEQALLLTNDTDFTTGGITVLTTHPKLLAACP